MSAEVIDRECLANTNITLTTWWDGRRYLLSDLSYIGTVHTAGAFAPLILKGILKVLSSKNYVRGVENRLKNYE